MLPPFNTAPQVVVTPNYKIIPFLLHNCNFDAAINYKVNVQYGTLKGVTAHGLKTPDLYGFPWTHGEHSVRPRKKMGGVLTRCSNGWCSYKSQSAQREDIENPRDVSRL